MGHGIAEPEILGIGSVGERGGVQGAAIAPAAHGQDAEPDAMKIRGVVVIVLIVVLVLGICTTATVRQGIRNQVPPPVPTTTPVTIQSCDEAAAWDQIAQYMQGSDLPGMSDEELVDYLVGRMDEHDVGAFVGIAENPSLENQVRQFCRKPDILAGIALLWERCEYSQTTAASTVACHEEYDRVLRERLREKFLQ